PARGTKDSRKPRSSASAGRADTELAAALMRDMVPLVPPVQVPAVRSAVERSAVERSPTVQPPGEIGWGDDPDHLAIFGREYPPGLAVLELGHNLIHWGRRRDQHVDA